MPIQEAILKAAALAPMAMDALKDALTATIIYKGEDTGHPDHGERRAAALAILDRAYGKSPVLVGVYQQIGNPKEACHLDPSTVSRATHEAWEIIRLEERRKEREERRLTSQRNAQKTNAIDMVEPTQQEGESDPIVVEEYDTSKVR